MQFPLPSEPAKVLLYADPRAPTVEETVVDLALMATVLSRPNHALACMAAYTLGAREAYLGMTTNLDAAGDDVAAFYETGRSHYAPQG